MQLNDSAVQYCFATCAKNLEGLLHEELQRLGITELKETVAGVYFQAPLVDAYRVCLWSRLANQVLLNIAEFEAATPEALYQGLQTIDWSLHFGEDDTFCLDISGRHSAADNALFLAQRAKDAIVDQFRAKTGVRPSVETARPHVMINLHGHGSQCAVNISLAGESLHRRGYRLDAGVAPLKETLAAAILLRAGWPKRALEPAPVLIDPMCGTGTLLIEAGLMAFDIAPGLTRDYFGFIGWRQHQADAWQGLWQEALDRRERGLQRTDVVLLGSDQHPQAIRKTQDNARRAGLLSRITVRLLDCADLTPQAVGLTEAPATPGLLICNPPYGERMQSDDLASVQQLLTTLGKRLQQFFSGWQLALFSGAPAECVKGLAIRAKRFYPLFNGTIPCKLYVFDIVPEQFIQLYTPQERQEHRVKQLLEQGLSPGAQTFANRLRKNLKHLRSWAKREGISCYRIYDADLPDYALAVDYYEGQWLHVQEYQAPSTIEPAKTQQRLREAVAVLYAECAVPVANIHVKTRQVQKGDRQYERMAEQGQFVTIHEGSARFWVNFTDYLDTGIFLDHRRVRARLAELAIGKTVLNLFAYTCTASVQAALAGARQVVSVDLSNTYLDWGCRNFELNGLSAHQHGFVQADCLQWLADQRFRFDLIFLNPPTFSNSKRMTTTWDVERDHSELLRLAMQRLTRDGALIFSSNRRNFKLDPALLTEYEVEDWSASTLCDDFARRANMHHVFLLRHPGG